MNTFRQRLIHLHRCEQATWPTILQLIKSDSTLHSLYQLTLSDLQDQTKLPLQTLKNLYNDLHSVTIASMLEQYKCQNIQCITVFDEHYPSLLKQINTPPWVLYAQGNIELLKNENLIAIVGTRLPTHYGKNMTRFFVQSLVKNGWITVSGLAKGIDSFVHQYTLDQKGKTIAVLGSGFQHLYPKENKKLAMEIIQDGLLLSEYPPHRMPRKWQFPERNRIISGLSLGTVVMEAKEKSGSLITADIALEQNREVFALPGPIDSKSSLGTNMLIQQGAKLIIHPEDIYSEIQIKIV